MLDIIIACFNEKSYLLNCLESIKKYISDLSKITVYICDDCSKYSKEYLELINIYKEYFNCIYQKTEKNSGPGIARNLGLKQSKSNFVIFLDDDDEIVNDVLQFCNNKYDFIITALNRQNGMVISSDDWCDSLQGIIFNNNFIKNNNLNFPTNLIKGIEDSVFRIMCLMLSVNYYKINQQFYQRNYRKDSHFGLIQMTYKSDFDKQIFKFKELFVWIACVFQACEDFNINIKDNEKILSFCIFLIKHIDNHELNLIYSQTLNITFNFILTLIYFILKYYDFNIKCSFKIKNNNDVMILELIDLINNNFLIDREKNIIILNKTNNLIEQIEHTKLLKKYICFFNNFKELDNQTQYYYPLSIISLFSNEYYLTCFENGVRKEHD